MRAKAKGVDLLREEAQREEEEEEAASQKETVEQGHSNHRKQAARESLALENSEFTERKKWPNESKNSNVPVSDIKCVTPYGRHL